jgi:hypothetical protein
MTRMRRIKKHLSFIFLIRAYPLNPRHLRLITLTY